MKNHIRFYMIPFVLGLVLTTVSCIDDNDTKIKEGSYLVSLRTQVSDGTADYILTANDLMNDTLTAAGQGIELSGWNYCASFEGSYFTFDYGLSECSGYKMIDGQLQHQGKFAFERIDLMAPLTEDLFLGIGAPWGGGSFDCQIQKIDIEDISISSNVNHPLYVSYDSEGNRLNAWPTAAYLEGNRLFVSFYPLNGSSWETPNTDTAYVSVFSYPEIQYIKTFKDSRTSPIGYYASQPTILRAENGDHYTLSSSSILAGYTQMTKPSAVLRIKAGAEEFDPEYYFNVESSGYKVLSGAYAGNGKVVAKVSKVENEKAEFVWGAFDSSTPALYAAILDLNAKTVTLVDDIPMHGGQYQTPYLVENGKVYISVNDGKDAFVYRVDPATATAERGARIIGNELQAIFSNN